MNNEDSTQYLKLIYASNALQESVFQACYADAHKAIWKEKYENFLNASDAKKTKCITLINACVHDLLSLMCEKFEFDAAQDLNVFYKEQSKHRGNFLKHAHDRIMRIGMQEIIKEQPHIQKQYAGVLVSETYKNNKLVEDAPYTLNLGGKMWLEKQAYAIASIYAIELAFISFEEGDITSFSNLQSDMSNFVSGPNYSDIYGIKGANKKHHDNRAIKKRAEEIYIEKSLFKYKNLHAAYEIYADLRKENITDISKSTLETSWVPEFKKKIKSLK